MIRCSPSCGRSRTTDGMSAGSIPIPACRRRSDTTCFYQRLDRSGVEQFAHNGVQIADLTNSSTEDYGLDIDTAGNALVAFLDTRENPNQQITAAKMSPSGQPLWGRSACN